MERPCQELPLQCPQPGPFRPSPARPIPAHSRVPLPQEPELSQQGRVLLGLLGGGLRGLFVFQPEPLNLLQDLPGEGTKEDERRTELSVCTAPEHFCSPSGSFCQCPAQAQGLCSPVAGTDSQPGQGREHSPGNRCRTWRIYSFVRMKSLMAMCLQPPPTQNRLREHSKRTKVPVAALPALQVLQAGLWSSPGEIPLPFPRAPAGQQEQGEPQLTGTETLKVSWRERAQAAPQLRSLCPVQGEGGQGLHQCSRDETLPRAECHLQLSFLAKLLSCSPGRASHQH